jgi:hypothetical protein
MRGFLIAAALTAPVLAAGAAQAGALPDGGATVQEIARVLQDKGYKAEIGKDRDGDPTIRSASDGGNFQLLFYGCKAGRCSSIQFHAAYDLADGMSLQKINDWNRRKRFGRAFLDEVNDPFVQMDVDLEHGSTTESVANNLDTWVQVFREFRAFIKE